MYTSSAGGKARAVFGGAARFAVNGLLPWYNAAYMSKGDVLMTNRSLIVEAIFENGILRPMQPLPLQPQQRVTITLELPRTGITWPDDVAAIYREIADEDRRLAEAMLPTIQETWPVSEGNS
jgi:predicted DNA-binding antitoxin AbrB/MazE fold protein